MGCTSTDIKAVIKNLLTLKYMNFVAIMGLGKQERGSRINSGENFLLQQRVIGEERKMCKNMMDVIKRNRKSISIIFI